MKLLVTGFAPFGGDAYNPSFEAAKRLPGEIDGCEIIVRELPVVFGSIQADALSTVSGSIQESDQLEAVCPDSSAGSPVEHSRLVDAVSGSGQSAGKTDRIASASLEASRYPPGSAPHALLSAIEETSPDAVLCVGVAGGRDAVTPEVIGINLMNARIPDNAGAQPLMEPIAPGGPDGLFSTLPVREMAEAIQQAGIPARLSFSAGSYVCNNVLYSLLLWIKEARPGMVGGFVHVPYAKEFLNPENKAPAMPLADITRALAVCVRELL